MIEERSLRYRWVILTFYMLVNISAQILWISYAPVTLAAVVYYGVGESEIIFMSTIFMIIYIPVSFIASWFINKFGFRIGVGLGAILNGLFGFLRFIAGPNYVLALIFQIIIAVGQPVLLNSVTLLSANWFPQSERTTATGLSVVSSLLGVAFGMILTPLIVTFSDISTMLFIYGLFSLIVGILFPILVKHKPYFSSLIRSNQGTVSLKKELRLLLSNKLFWILIVNFFINLGAFNMVTTYIELIIVPRGLSSIDAGILGGLLLLGGIIGTIMLAPLSDKLHKRKLLIITSNLIAVIGIFVLTFASNIVVFNLFGFLYGIGLLSAGPLVLEYAVEITKPVPEASSNGLLMVVGAISGILFIIGFERFTTPSGDYFPALIFLSILSLISFVLTFFIKDIKKEY